MELGKSKSRVFKDQLSVVSVEVDRADGIMKGIDPVHAFRVVIDGHSVWPRDVVLGQCDAIAPVQITSLDSG